MALKKSELYASLWKSCDELRAGMGASQYKDYILVLLFVKYVSDKYAGDPDGLIEVPIGGSFADMVAAKGDKEIGDRINKIIGRLADANDSPAPASSASVPGSGTDAGRTVMLPLLDVGVRDVPRTSPSVMFSKNSALVPTARLLKPRVSGSMESFCRARRSVGSLSEKALRFSRPGARKQNPLDLTLAVCA